MITSRSKSRPANRSFMPLNSFIVAPFLPNHYCNPLALAICTRARPEAVEIQIAFGRARTICEWQVNIFKAVQPAGPPLRCPGLVEFIDESVLLLEPGDEPLFVGHRVRHVAVANFIVVADGYDCGIMCEMQRHRFAEDLQFARVIRIADVIHIALRRWKTRPVLRNNIHAWVRAVQPDWRRRTRYIQNHPDSVFVHFGDT